jgi:hypothetical protein
MPKATRDKVAKRAKHSKKPDLKRSKKSDSNKTERPGLGVTLARELTAAATRPKRLSHLAEPLKMFARFPYLPIELRLMIWDLAKPGPRRIDVHLCWGSYRDAVIFRAETPVLLHVCRESRYEMLKTYKCAFKHDMAINGCYFDFTRDILYLAGWWSKSDLINFVLKSKGKGDFERVQNLGITGIVFDTMILCRTHNDRFNEVLLHFQSLKEMITVDSNPHNCLGIIAIFIKFMLFSDQLNSKKCILEMALAGGGKPQWPIRHLHGDISATVLTKFREVAFTYKRAYLPPGASPSAPEHWV